MEVTAHVHSGFFSLQYPSGEQKAYDRIILTTVNNELVAHFILCSSFLWMIFHTAVQYGQDVSMNNFVRMGVNLKRISTGTMKHFRANPRCACKLSSLVQCDGVVQILHHCAARSYLSIV